MGVGRGLCSSIRSRKCNNIRYLPFKLYKFKLTNVDWIFNCNTRYITEAYGHKTYNYRYSIRPSIHAADLFLTFMDVTFDWRGKRQFIEFPYARAWQSYLVSFIKHGDPNVHRRRETIEWDLAGKDMNILDLRWEGFQWDVDDQVDPERCAFWQKAEYAPPWNIPPPRNMSVGVVVNSSRIVP